DSSATVGVSLITEDLPIIAHTYGFLESLPIGATRAIEVITVNIKGFGKIFKGDVRADKALSGPVGIAKMFGTEVKDRKSTRLNSSHVKISYAVFCLKKKNTSKR